MKGRFRFREVRGFGAAFSITAISLLLCLSSYALTMAADYSAGYPSYLPSSLYSLGQNFSAPASFSSLYFTPSYLPSSLYSSGQTFSFPPSYATSYSYSPSPYSFDQNLTPQTSYTTPYSYSYSSPSYSFGQTFFQQMPFFFTSPYSPGMPYSLGIPQSASFFAPPFSSYPYSSSMMPGYGNFGSMTGPMGEYYGGWGAGAYGSAYMGYGSAYMGYGSAYMGYGGAYGYPYGSYPGSLGGGVIIGPWPPPSTDDQEGEPEEEDPPPPTESYEVQGKGRILDSGGRGITGLIVRIKGSERKTFTVNLLDDSGQLEGGYYFFHDVAVSLEGLELEIVSPDNHKILATRPVPPLTPFELTSIPDISLPPSLASSVYSERLKGLNLPDNLAPDGDYDGDQLSNREEILLYLTHPGLTTILLSLSGGLNLFYFPSVVDSLNMIPYDPNSHRLCSYNPFTGCWGKEDLLKQGRFNALYAGSPAVLFVNLRSNNQRPVLCLRGFGDRAFDQKTMTGLMKIMIRDLFDLNPADFEFDQIMADLLNAIIQDLYGLDPACFEPDSSYLPSRIVELMNKLIQNLFDPACFEPDASTLAILEHDTFTGVHMISSLNPGHGKWEASYRFFGKSAGDELRVKPNRVYTLMKGKEE